MSGLKIRDFSDDKSSSRDLDFKDLESNPKFNGGEPKGDEGKEPQGVNEPKGDEGNGGKEPQGVNEPKGDEGKEPQGSKDKPDGSTEPKGDEGEPKAGDKSESELTEEKVLEFLSKKFDRPVTSLEDLTKSEQKDVDEDPFIKGLRDWSKDTGKPYEDYFKYQKDYSKLDDVDVVREFLQLEYPDFDESEIELELRQYLPDDVDLDEEAAIKRLNLKKLATKGRAKLEEFRGSLAEPSRDTLTPEMKKSLDYAREAQEYFQSSREKQSKYLEEIKVTSSKTDSLKVNLGEDLDISYNLDESAKKEIPNLVENAPHWKNGDGSWNHQAVVEDAIKIKHFDEIIKMVYEQGQNAGKEGLTKEMKNITLDNTKSMGSGDSGKNKGFTIEDEDKLFSKNVLKIRN